MVVALLNGGCFGCLPSGTNKQLAFEHGPFIVDLPIKVGGFPEFFGMFTRG